MDCFRELIRHVETHVSEKEADNADMAPPKALIVDENGSDRDRYFDELFPAYDAIVQVRPRVDVEACRVAFLKQRMLDLLDGRWNSDVPSNFKKGWFWNVSALRSNEKSAAPAEMIVLVSYVVNMYEMPHWELCPRVADAWDNEPTWTSTRQLRSSRHGVRCRAKRTFDTLGEAVAFLDGLATHGPCPDAVTVTPPCSTPIPVALEEIACPILRRAAQAKFYFWPRHLPPYAETTVAAFEAANNMTFPGDLRWFLTRVSRELLPLHVIKLCRKAPGVQVQCRVLVKKISGSFWAEQKSRGDAFLMSEAMAEEVAAELSSMGAAAGGDSAGTVLTDAGRVCRFIDTDGIWKPRRIGHGKCYTFPEVLGFFSRDPRLTKKCDKILASVTREGLEVDMWEGWDSGLVVGPEHAEDPAQTDSDAAEDPDSRWGGPGRMLLSNFGCSCDVFLVTRGPLAGCVTYKYQVLTAERDVIFPNFTAFVAVVINGGYHWQHQHHEDGDNDEDGDGDEEDVSSTRACCGVL